MPKFSWLRHQLAEKQARLSGDIKNTITQHPEEVKIRIMSMLIGLALLHDTLRSRYFMSAIHLYIRVEMKCHE